MTSTDSVQVVKRVSSAKKSPLKVVGPIIKKYTGHRQGKIKNKLVFPRVLHSGRSKKSVKPQFKTILPKTNAGNVIILEPELLPCALNLLKMKRTEGEAENSSESCSNLNHDNKSQSNSQAKECSNKVLKGKVISTNKKKLKCLRNLEASLELLSSKNLDLREKREQTFAENYFQKIQERLKGTDENTYNQFVDLICDFQVNRLSVCDLFRRIKSLLSSHGDLVEDFVAFLTPEQAVECGVFMEHLFLTTMSDFLHMLDVYFVKSPQQVKKIYSVLESLATKPNVTSETVLNSVLPLLKGNSVLNDYFMHLLPDTKPPESFCTDFEEVEYSEINSDVSDEEDVAETIHLPDVEDPYGGDSCPCSCHEKFCAQVQHCTLCSMKFINGRIFIQNGKLLRPAKVVFDDHDVEYHRERLTPKQYPKRSKKRHRLGNFKDNLSPTKSCNLSSDEFKSDIEEEEKGRSKVGFLKSPRTNRKKSVSPKHCDKAAAKWIFHESKEDAADSKERTTPAKISDSPAADGGAQSKVHTPCGETAGKRMHLDLPKIDFEGFGEETWVEGWNEKRSNVAESGRLVKGEEPDEGEGARSPPVISIPENGNSLFASSKPILSLLENLNDSKNGLINLLGNEVTEVKLEVAKETLKDEEIKHGRKNLPWQIEEDRVILQTLQVEKNCDETFLKIGKSIPERSVEDIKMRFAELMDILYEMKSQNR